MSNEVAHDFDALYLDFIETNGLQIWPDRKTRESVIFSWTVQCAKPFLQVSHETLKGALTKMAFRLGDLRFKEPNA